MAGNSRAELVGGASGISAPLNSTLPRRERSVAHAIVLFAVLLCMSLGFGLALLGNSPMVAVIVLLVVLISAGVMSVAWMRPASGSPEHHPKIDHLLDDSSP
jgi:predicted Na+-dependent transporter